MTTRRDFLKTGTAAAATGIVFCSCGLLQSAHAQPPARQKLPVTVGGKRVKTIDVHAHCVIPEASKLLGDDAPAAASGARRGRGRHRDRQASRRHGRAGGRHGGAVDQSQLVQSRPRSRRANRQAPEREAGRTLRLEAGSLRGFCVAHLAGAGSCGAGTGNRRQEAGPEGRGDRRQCQRRGVFRSEISSGVGQGGRTRRALVHPSAGRPRTQQATGRQRLADQRGRLSRRDDDCALAHDLRGYVRPLSQAESDRRPWRGFSSFLCGSFGPCLSGQSGGMQPERQARQAAHGISQADLFRFTGVHARGAPPSGGPGRRGQIVLGSDYPFPWQLQPVDHIFASASLNDDDKADILGRTAAKLLDVET